MQTFVSRNRKPRFELFLKIVDLNNVPLVSGTSYVKWHLPFSSAADHRGKTDKFSIKNNKVEYHYEKTTQIRLIVGKDLTLQEALIHFEVMQEYPARARTERITLGTIKLNLAEYVDTETPNSAESPRGNGPIVRRYLMQDSKVNSTLRIELDMRQIEGERNFTAPPLRVAPVFGGIAGIISSDIADIAPCEGTDGQEAKLPAPSLSNRSRETGEMHDLYRSTLAASWSAYADEPRADDCIEDIFAGGDGWSSVQDRVEETSSSSGGNKSSSVNFGNGGNGARQRYRRMSERSQSGTPMPSFKKPSLARNYQSQNDVFDNNDEQNSVSNLSGLFGNRDKFSPKRPAGLRRGSTSYLNQDRPVDQQSLAERRSSDILRNSITGSKFGSDQQMFTRQGRGNSIGTMDRNLEIRNYASQEIDEFDNPFKDDLRSWNIGSTAVG